MDKGYQSKDSTTQWQSEQDEWASGDYEKVKEIPDWLSEESGFELEEIEGQLDRLKELSDEQYKRASEEIKDGLLERESINDILADLLGIPENESAYDRWNEKMREELADQVLEDGEAVGDFLESIWEERYEATKIDCNIIVEKSYELAGYRVGGETTVYRDLKCEQDKAPKPPNPPDEDLGPLDDLPDNLCVFIKVFVVTNGIRPELAIQDYHERDYAFFRKSSPQQSYIALSHVTNPELFDGILDGKIFPDYWWNPEANRAFPRWRRVSIIGWFNRPTYDSTLAQNIIDGKYGEGSITRTNGGDKVRRHLTIFVSGTNNSYVYYGTVGAIKKYFSYFPDAYNSVLILNEYTRPTLTEFEVVAVYGFDLKFLPNDQPYPDDNMSDRCCKANLRLSRQIAQALGTHQLPLQLPSSLRRGDDAPVNLTSVPEMYRHWIATFDDLMGEFPFKVKVETDEGQESNIEGMTVADAFADLFVLLVHVYYDADNSFEILQKLFLENNKVFLTTKKTYDYIESISEQLGFELDRKTYKQTLSFDPRYPDNWEKYNREYFPEKDNAETVINRDTDTVKSFLMRIMFTSSLLKEAFTVKGSPDQIVNRVKAIAEIISSAQGIKVGGSDDAAWEAAVKELNKEADEFNPEVKVKDKTAQARIIEELEQGTGAKDISSRLGLNLGEVQRTIQNYREQQAKKKQNFNLKKK